MAKTSILTTLGFIATPATMIPDIIADTGFATAPGTTIWKYVAANYLGLNIATSKFEKLDVAARTYGLIGLGMGGSWLAKKAKLNTHLPVFVKKDLNLNL